MRRLIVLVGSVAALLIGAAGVDAHPAQAAWGQPNGCGTGGWVNTLLGANPYNEQFRPACDLHDWCYGGAAKPVPAGVVGDWLVRKRCDDLFLGRMLATCGGNTSCEVWANEYYDAVRTFGDSILFGRPYTSGQREGQSNLLPNPGQSTCAGCVAGATAPTAHVSVRGSNTTYWKLDAGAWHRLGCPAWDPDHVACTADVVLGPVDVGTHVIRVKAVDALTGAVGHTWPIATWTT